MKIIDNINNKENRVICECGEILEYEPLDVRTGSFGAPYITCPNCLADIDIDGEKYDKHITTKSIKFPDDFYHFNNAAPISNNEINEWIKECISNIKENEIESTFIGSGDTMVFVYKMEDEYAVYVAKNYYETSIPR